MDDHVSVADDPNVILGWLIANVTVGAGVVGAVGMTGVDVDGAPPPPPPQPAMVMSTASMAVMFRVFIQAPK
ncbi:hypothetical protein ACO0K7_17035 [Undibacterium sp. Ji67W]|uniref:hypothetical protein n=1 Tax=Undibacterium sp. Ji67W TaxID=3413042 RepID=UPI003BF1609B